MCCGWADHHDRRVALGVLTTGLTTKALTVMVRAFVWFHVPANPGGRRGAKLLTVETLLPRVPQRTCFRVRARASSVSVSFFDDDHVQEQVAGDVWSSSAVVAVLPACDVIACALLTQVRDGRDSLAGTSIDDLESRPRAVHNASDCSSA